MHDVRGSIFFGSFGIKPVGEARSLKRDRARTVMNHIQKGKISEDRAAAYLEQAGHTILDRNWRHGRHEVDIISETDGFVVVTEVKSAVPGSTERPEDAVNRKKQLGIIRTAEAWVWEHRPAKPVRFDVIFVGEGPSGILIEHIRDAFYPTT